MIQRCDYALLFAGSRLFRLSRLDSGPVLPLEEISAPSPCNQCFTMRQTVGGTHVMGLVDMRAGKEESRRREKRLHCISTAKTHDCHQRHLLDSWLVSFFSGSFFTSTDNSFHELTKKGTKANSEKAEQQLVCCARPVARCRHQNLNKVSITMSLRAEATGGRSLVMGLRWG